MLIMNMCKHFILISVLFHIRCSLTADPGDFDYYKLVLQWPGTVCNAAVVKCTDKWTVHGLWPAYKLKNDPIKCSKVGYNEQEIMTIMDDMKTYWPNLQKDNNTNFWKHEWESHGTCSNLTIEGYFKRTINLAKNHDVKSYLQKKDIVPGNTYKSDDISTAILDSVKVSPALRKNCKQKNNRVNFDDTLTQINLVWVRDTPLCSLWSQDFFEKEDKLQEIFICYTKGFALMDCKEGDSNVKKNVLLSYPQLPNQQLAAALYQGDGDTCDDASSDSTSCVHFRVIYPIALALVVYCYNYNWK